jgi:hypothetical protein
VGITRLTSKECAAIKKNCINRPITNANETIEGHDLCHYHFTRVQMGLDMLEDLV